MEIFNNSGVTKTGELSVQRPIGAIMIATDDLGGTLNEEISIHVQSASANNIRIATKIKLKAMMDLAQYRNGRVFLRDGRNYAFIPIATGGAIQLADDEYLKIELNNLRSAQAYEVHYVEALGKGTPVKYDQKVAQSDETVKDISLAGFTQAIIRGVDSVSKIVAYHKNGDVRNYSPLTLYGLAAQYDDVASQTATGLQPELFSNHLVFPCASMSKIEIEKSSGQAVNVEMVAQ